MGIAAEPFLHLQRQRVHASPHIGDTAREAPSSLFRYCRRQLVRSDWQIQCRRAMAVAWRLTIKLSSTKRSLSSSDQYRRRPPSVAKRISIWGRLIMPDLSSDLPSQPTQIQSAAIGGLLFWTPSSNMDLLNALTAEP